MAEPEDSDDEEIEVGPVEAESAAEVLARIEARERSKIARQPAGHIEREPPSAENFRFTLTQMFVAITVLCVWLGIVRAMGMLNKGLAAGVTGLIALLGMFVLVNREGSPSPLWWALLAVYLVTSALTLWVA